MRTRLLNILATAIEDADNRRCPDGYADVQDNEDVSDWAVFLADAALIALAENGFNIAHDPIEAVKDFKTWPQPDRIRLGARD